MTRIVGRFRVREIFVAAAMVMMALGARTAPTPANPDFTASQTTASPGDRAERLRQHQARIESILQERRRAQTGKSSWTYAAGSVGAAFQTPKETTEPESLSRPVSVAFQEVPVERALEALGKQADITILPMGRTAGQRVSLLAKDLPLRAVLDAMNAQRNDWLWYMPPGMSGRIEIWDRLSYEREVLPTFAQTRVFDIREIYVDEAANVFKPLMTRTVGSITVVPSSRTVVVTDLPGKLELFADLLEQVDKVPAAEHSRGDSQTTTPR